MSGYPYFESYHDILMVSQLFNKDGLIALAWPWKIVDNGW